MSDDRHLKCLQPAIKEKFPVVFRRKWTISKFCRRECSLVLYAKNGSQAILASVFNWAPDLLVSLGKSKRHSISTLIKLGLEPLTLLTGVAYESANNTENSRRNWWSRITVCLHCLGKLQSMTKTLDWSCSLFLYLWKEIHASIFGGEYF